MTNEEKKEIELDKLVCSKCGNNTFRVYITVIIYDVRLYCTKCNHLEIK